ncbi:Protein transport protein sec1 [Ceratocystis fimbriata CBS 114723]|uniref:Protein transport protein sec1 n=1 Tax=Ceratocystis fimbriata CBS 114723 TaxID=1035309 RepID=A0A2C5WYD7_9PEZI|nr:Protein transport protein sec1 [Ceratocystis fimbriata CBS 114723]
MSSSVIEEHRQVMLSAIERVTRGDWKVLICDKTSRQTLSVIPDDDILNKNIMNIEVLEDRREPNPDMDAIYFLSNTSFTVDCLLADLEHRKYRSAYLLWTGRLLPKDEERIHKSPAARMIRGFEVLMIDFQPRESHLVVFKDPWSFPLLFHNGCNEFVAPHMRVLAQKIASVCITMGEAPKVRYYMPPNPRHEASVLCTHLARFVQEEFDNYSRRFPDFPPKTSRPQGTLLILDRSIDLMAPIVHEFTYQAMAHDLLPIEEGDKVTYSVLINQGTPEEERKVMELQEKDKVWTENRHRHMKDTIGRLMSELQKFMSANHNFVNPDESKTSLNTIKDMMAGLPQFQETKEAYSLHINIAEQCMALFQQRKLPDVAAVEQTLATGLDEDLRKPKGVLEQVVRLLDDEAVPHADRLRLVIMYILFRDGIITEDINRLLAHSQLPVQDRDLIFNLNGLGALATRDLKDPRPLPEPLFPPDTSQPVDEEYTLSRFKPILKYVLEELTKGTLRQDAFPYVIPPQNPNEDLIAAQSGSLRAARGNWAASGRRQPENRQRNFVYVAGGATYSESRCCYEIANEQNKDVYLISSHMQTPSLFVRQVADLSMPPKTLDIPMMRPKQRPPAHLFENHRPQPPPPKPNGQGGGHPGYGPTGGGLPGGGSSGGAPPGGGQRMPMSHGQGGAPLRPPVAPPTAAMSQMKLGAPAGGVPQRPMHQPHPSSASAMSNASHSHSHSHLQPHSPDDKKKDKDKDKKDKEKKKRHFFKK